MSILAEIVDHKKVEVARRRSMLALPELRRQINGLPAPRDFAGAVGRRSPAIIAEIKRRSPSRGELLTGISPTELAREYEAGGAAAISVLTDERFFGMPPAELGTVRQAVSLPLLRKDFILDEYMLLESRLLGADALLLIAALLTQGELAELVAQTHELGLAALVETRSAAEIESALTAGARIIGINARDLNTYRVDLAVVSRLARLLPPDVLLVAESGIKSKDDITALTDSGARAFLVGEALLTAEDPRQLLFELCTAEVQR